MKNLVFGILVLSSLIIIVYTFMVGFREGWDLFPVFINNIRNFNWNGQFNLDFQFYLILSAIWLIWRNGTSLPSILFAVVCAVLGFMIFGPYLIYLFAKEKGDVRKILLGNHL